MSIFGRDREQSSELSQRYFKNLSDSLHSRTLISCYAWIKSWLVGAESHSKMASGTEEDDEELRHLILRVQSEEDVSMFLILYFTMNLFSVQALSLIIMITKTSFFDLSPPRPPAVSNWLRRQNIRRVLAHQSLWLIIGNSQRPAQPRSASMQAQTAKTTARRGKLRSVHGGRAHPMVTCSQTRLQGSPVSLLA